jgi:peptidoglycan/LPS O-acetylase OafA/YrhL
VRIHLGWLTFLLATAFAILLLLTLISSSWLELSINKGLYGFFGFGIPMIAVGAGAAELWSDDKPLKKLLGWTSTVTGILCGVAVLSLVADWVFFERTQPVIGNLLGFATAGLVCGGFGIEILRGCESNA